jgi:hypothetical protein
LVNANDDAMAFTVPADLADNWELELDSARPTDIPIAATPALDITRAITVEGFSVVVLRSPRAPAVRHC